MTDEEKKAWEELVDRQVMSRHCSIAAYGVAGNDPVLAADTIIKRAGDVKLIHAFLRSERCSGEIDDPFIAYQEAKISKGKLCDIIAKSLSEWLLGK